MIMFEIQMLLITFFLASIFGYIIVVMKEKSHLKGNTIIIDKKSVTQDFIDDAEIKIFMLGNEEIRTGDEVKLITSNNKRLEGIVIGARIEQNELMLVTHKDEVTTLKVDMIKKIKVVSKYGMFFKAF